jgi:hypothetical protein
MFEPAMLGELYANGKDINQKEFLYIINIKKALP